MYLSKNQMGPRNPEWVFPGNGKNIAGRMMNYTLKCRKNEDNGR